MERRTFLGIRNRVGWRHISSGGENHFVDALLFLCLCLSCIDFGFSVLTQPA